MRIPTKFFLASIGAIFLPLALLAYFGYHAVESELQELTVLRLESIADVEKKSIRAGVASTVDRFALIVTRTQLRQSLAAFQDDGGSEHVARMTTILTDAKSASGDIRDLFILDHEDASLVARGLDPIPEFVPGPDLLDGWGNGEIRTRIMPTEAGDLLFVTGPIEQDGVLVGVAVLAVDAGSVFVSKSDHAGLGRTGEVLIARRMRDGNAAFIGTTRFPSAPGALEVVRKEQLNIPITHSMNRAETVLESGLDYRGELVFAATRHVEEADLGIVVKIDKSEALEPLARFRSQVVLLAAVLMALSVGVALLLAESLTKPILALSERAMRMARGDLRPSEGVRRRDEIGDLQLAFDVMAGRLQGTLDGLDELVEKKTAQLSTLVDQLPIGVFLVEAPSGKPVLMNEKAKDLLGRGLITDTGPATYSRKYVTEKEDGSEYPSKDLPLSIALTEGRPVVKDDVFARKPSGARLNLRVSAAPIKDRSGRIHSAVAVFYDRTEDFLIERRKSEMISLATHQLKTPPLAVKWNAELMLGGDVGRLTKKQKGVLNSIKEVAEQMLETVETFLNISRVELGTFSVQRAPVDVAEVAEGVLEELAPLVKEKALKVERDFAKGLGPLQGDAELLRNVVLNLVSNAVKYTPEKGRVRIGVRETEEGGHLIEVEDSGIGIPEEEQQRVFERMFRASNAQDADGTGFGLYLVRQILEASGGTVAFESKEGKGTVFRVAFPPSGMIQREGTSRIS